MKPLPRHLGVLFRPRSISSPKTKVFKDFLATETVAVHLRKLRGSRFAALAHYFKFRYAAAIVSEEVESFRGTFTPGTRP